MTARPCIQVVAHTLERSGAPVWLLTFLRWLRSNAHADFELVYAGSTELLADFSAICRVRPIAERPVGPRRPAILYANSAWAHRFLPPLVTPGDVIISHVHELPMSLRGIDLAPAGAVPWHYIAAAECVRANLIEHHGLSARSVTTVHSFIDTQAAIHTRQPPPTPTVAAVGSLNHHKGPDLFLDLARRYRDRYASGTTFIWIGGVEPELGQLRSEIGRRGLAGTVTAAGYVDDVMRRLSQETTVFVLPSREDSFPLVCLEAAATRVPILAFRQGGTPEFLTPANLVDAFDLDAMCTRLHDAIADGALKQATTMLSSRVQEFDVHVKAPEIWQLIEAAHARLHAR